VEDFEQNDVPEFNLEDRIASRTAHRIMTPPDWACRRCGVEIDGFRGVIRLGASARTFGGLRAMDEVPAHVFDSARSLCPACWSGLLAFLGPPEGRQAKEAPPCTR
jgi:hypothetical protein